MPEVNTDCKILNPVRKAISLKKALYLSFAFLHNKDLILSIKFSAILQIANL